MTGDIKVSNIKYREGGSHLMMGDIQREKSKDPIISEPAYIR
jgi:hypothetical protein